MCSVPAKAIRWRPRFAKRTAPAALGVFLLSMSFSGCAKGAAGNTPGQMPAIASFTANPPAVAPGDTTILNWNVKNASSLSITGDTGGSVNASNSVAVSSTSVSVKPSTTTTYTLTATNTAGQSVTATTTVGVGPVPVLSNLKATPSTIGLGQISTLSWDGTNLASVNIDNGVGTVTGNSVGVSPAVTTTYTLTPQNSVGLAGNSQTLTVTVVAPPAILRFKALPSSINSGKSSILTWAVSGATSLSIDNGVGPVTGSTGTVTVSPVAAQTTYTLTATETSGPVSSSTTATAKVTISSVPLPVITSFTTDHASVGPGGSVNLTAVFDAAGGTASIDNGVGPVVSGVPTSVTVDPPTTFSLTVTNGTATRSVSAQVRVIDGSLSAFAGQAGAPGRCDVTGLAGVFAGPLGVAVDTSANVLTSGNIYVADSGNHVICQISPDGTVVSLLAGTAGVPGHKDDPGAQFNTPTGLAVDGNGNIYVADSQNDTIRKITNNNGTWTVSTLAGTAGQSGSQDGPGCADPLQGCAQFFVPTSLAVDAFGNVYVADSHNNVIRKIRPDGTVSTLAGTAPTLTNPNNTGSIDAVGPAASFNDPGDVALDSNGNVYVADVLNHTIRQITPAGAVITLAGQAGLRGSADGTGTTARFDTPSGVAVDASGNVYVADQNKYTIRKITPTPTGVVVSTIVGTAGTPYFLPGGPLPGKITTPNQVAVFPDPSDPTHASGTLYISITNGVYKAPY